jgi:hypothetical protein
MTEPTRRKGDDEGRPMVTPGGPQAPADPAIPSDPPAAPPGRTAGGHGAEVQVPMGSPEREVGTPGREAPSPEIAPGDRSGDAAGPPSTLGEPSDHPVPRGAPEREP